jgi:hypothetical protein
MEVAYYVPIRFTAETRGESQVPFRDHTHGNAPVDTGGEDSASDDRSLADSKG